MRKLLLILVTLLCFVPYAGYGTEYTASSCSYAEVKTKVDGATDGDIVNIPVGDCDWGTDYLYITHGIKLRGAKSEYSTTLNDGTCNPLVSTCISGSGPDGSSTKYYGMIRISMPTGGGASALEISNLHITHTSTVVNQYIMSLQGNSKDWKIYNNYLYHSATSTYKTGMINIVGFGSSADWMNYGIFYNNVLRNIYMYLNGAGTSEGSWSSATSWGGPDNLFIEANIFDNRDRAVLGVVGVSIDSQNGAKGVVRYNTFYDGLIIAHGACQTSIRGPKRYDIYNNNFLLTNTYTYFIELWNGSAVITRNKIAGWVDQAGTGHYGYVMVKDRRAGSTACSTGFGNCTGSDADDTNSASPAHYIDAGNSISTICLDQVGAGVGAKTSQTIDPVYVWGNTTGKICTNGLDKYSTCASNDDCDLTENGDKGGTCSTQTLTPNNIWPYDSGSTYAIRASRDYFDTASGSNEKFASVIYYPTENYNTYICPHPLADPSAQGSCATTGDSQYGIAGYTLTGGGSDETAPTVTSGYVYGATTVFHFLEPITATSGAAFTVAGLASALTLTCPAVETAASSMTCTNSRTVYQSEGNGTYGYTGTKVIDVASNALAAIESSPTAVNMSTEVETPPTRTLTVNKTGSGCGITSSPSGISVVGATASDTAELENGTVVTLGGWLYQGWALITYGGDCAANGTVTMDAAKTCTVTCTPIYVLPW